MIPRIRGKVGQIEEPIEDRGKYAFTLWLTTVGGGEGKELGTWGPYPTEAEAKAEMKKTAQVAVEAWEIHSTGSKSGKYIDMQTNELRRWEEN